MAKMLWPIDKRCTPPGGRRLLKKIARRLMRRLGKRLLDDAPKKVPWQGYS